VREWVKNLYPCALVQYTRWISPVKQEKRAAPRARQARSGLLTGEYFP
jgi:hypothetical protein